MLRRLYDWTMALAARKTAELWLAVIAFIESSVFLVPADVLFIPITLPPPPPPIKGVPLLSGPAGVNLWLFVGSAILARGARFFALAWLLNRYGEPIRDFIEHRLGWIAGAVAGFVVVLYL